MAFLFRSLGEKTIPLLALPFLAGPSSDGWAGTAFPPPLEGKHGITFISCLREETDKQLTKSFSKCSKLYREPKNTYVMIWNIKIWERQQKQFEHRVPSPLESSQPHKEPKTQGSDFQGCTANMWQRPVLIYSICRLSYQSDANQLSKLQKMELLALTSQLQYTTESELREQRQCKVLPKASSPQGIFPHNITIFKILQLIICHFQGDSPCRGLLLCVWALRSSRRVRTSLHPSILLWWRGWHYL